MKIVYLHQYFKTPDMAGGTRSYEMARRLVSWGHEVHIVTSRAELRAEALDWHTELIDGINVHWFNNSYNNTMGFYARIRSFFRFAYAAAKKSALLRGDLVFATSTPLTIALPGVYAAKKSKCPMVFEVRDLWPEVPIALEVIKNPLLIYASRALELFAYKNSAHIVALSEDMANGIVKRGIERNKVSVIPNSADLDLFDPNHIRPGLFKMLKPELLRRPMVLYPGTLGRVNGVSYLVQLAEAVRPLNSDISFVVIGEGAELDKVKKLAVQNGTLGCNFFHFPPMPKVELVNAFRDSVAIISLVIDVEALEANSANKFFDGLAAGKPIIINHGGWQKELIEVESLGVVLPRDVTEAALVLSRFLKNKDLVHQSGENARRIAKDRFSREDLAKRLEKIFIQVCSG
ncbi:glycosyltransferase family 4 protein [Pusillimonas sp. MFBS29]|uniref:glycosyltransferase family 4 protein n=1 Tax=Pusillimonas sp. MFBS29 TaxID=2886690 RepID=UPI001D1303CF|nr:glycosyltransferase family 4 protein [Pusillimonas sp. MFBS29]MCC2597541.1 glycosyltransferase family 4 protein [Pusillimonas sp. MFBS29]